METKKTKKERCNHINCRKKLGLIKFECRCGLNFCLGHKHPESHNCTYDYQCSSKDALKDKLVKVVNDKVIKI